MTMSTGPSAATSTNTSAAASATASTSIAAGAAATDETSMAAGAKLSTTIQINSTKQAMACSVDGGSKNLTINETNNNNKTNNNKVNDEKRETTLKKEEDAAMTTTTTVGILAAGKTETTGQPKLSEAKTDKVEVSAPGIIGEALRLQPPPRPSTQTAATATATTKKLQRKQSVDTRIPSTKSSQSQSQSQSSPKETLSSLVEKAKDTTTSATSHSIASSSTSSSASASMKLKAEIVESSSGDRIQAAAAPGCGEVVVKKENKEEAIPTTVSTALTSVPMVTIPAFNLTPLPPPPPPSPSPSPNLTSSETAMEDSPESPAVKESLDYSSTGSSHDILLARPRPVLLSAVNPHIICNLCYGYLIDATTIVECLHSFCHSCLIRHLRTEQYCPRCEMMINTAKPNIKPDTTLQAIVYKLVPGLYEKELMRKRAFYKDRPAEAALATPEQRGDDTEHLIFSPSDYMSLSLEYADMDDHHRRSSEYMELLKPRYLQCPAMSTVSHLKKFVYGKFEIDPQRFNIDIMYKVKTIVLFEHYTLMDVAYIYTWKRDAPMRFYFRVKKSLRPRMPRGIGGGGRQAATLKSSRFLAGNVIDCGSDRVTTEMQTIDATPVAAEKAATPSTTRKHFEIVSSGGGSGSQNPGSFSSLPTFGGGSALEHQTAMDRLKITLVSKPLAKDGGSGSGSGSAKHAMASPNAVRDDRRVENIKLKIDLSKQNSVTIINMSDPQRKEIVKPVKPEKEWKVKTKKDRETGGSKTSSPISGERKSKTPSPLTVPPLTIKAERISPSTKKIFELKTPSPPAGGSSPIISAEDDQKSQFLKSFALTPIKVKSESPEKLTSPMTSPPKLTASPPKLATSPKSYSSSSAAKSSSPITSPSTKSSAPPAPAPVFKTPAPSKRKSKEPVKAIAAKKPRVLSASAFAMDDFKIKLPSQIPHPVMSMSSTNRPGTPPVITTTAGKPMINIAAAAKANDKPLMPPPAAPGGIMRPRYGAPKKMPHKPPHKVSPPGSLTPHPIHGNIQVSAPGNRTPIAKRYQPILPKAARPNPFANIPDDVNKILKDAGTEIKTIPNDNSAIGGSKVYGPKSDGGSGFSLMGPPPVPKSQNAMRAPGSMASSANRLSNGGGKATATSNNYLNLALFNASKSKGNEAPPGCRTPIYSPNSPIYSPSSPQYVPNYNIPTVPTYKYTPKPNSSNNSGVGGANVPTSSSPNSLLHSILTNTTSGNMQMASLFPMPPTRKETNSPPISSLPTPTPTAGIAKKPNEGGAPKRVYPFNRSPSPGEDPPEKQLKVKSLLTSCNINIPSSLSITITREDGDSQTNNGSHPKHKSPVNNYIEILKLPDTPGADTSNNSSSNNKRTSSPAQKAIGGTAASKCPPPPQPPKKDISPIGNFKNGEQSMAMSVSLATTQKPAPHHNSSIQAMSQKPSATQVTAANNGVKPTPGGRSFTNDNQSFGHQSGKSMPQPSTATSTASAMPTASNKSTSNGEIMPSKSLTSDASKMPTGQQTKTTIGQHQPALPPPADKKTPSPEKRSAAPQHSSSNGDSKSPKSPSSGGGENGQSTAKKFRHILPRQNPTAITEVIPPKVTTANVIGTYSAPSGVPVKVHANKKVPVPEKKSPNQNQSLQQQPPKEQGANSSSPGGGAAAAQKSMPGIAGSKQSATATPKPTTATPKATTATPKPTTASPKSSPGGGGARSGNNDNNSTKTVASPKIASPTSSSDAVATFTSTAGPMPNLAPHHQLQAAAAAAAAAAAMPSIAQMPAHPLGVAAALAVANAAAVANANATAASQAEQLSKLLQHAAASNPANMFYSYAAAAQLSGGGQFHSAAASSPASIFNYQQAYMEQLSRMQRVGNDALVKYMQKLKSTIAAEQCSPPSGALAAAAVNNKGDKVMNSIDLKRSSSDGKQLQMQQKSSPAPSPKTSPIPSPSMAAATTKNGSTLTNGTTTTATTSSSANISTAATAQTTAKVKQSSSTSMAKTKTTTTTTTAATATATATSTATATAINS